MHVAPEGKGKMAPGQIYLCLDCLDFYSDYADVSTMVGGKDVGQDPNGRYICLKCRRRMVLYNRGEKA